MQRPSPVALAEKGRRAIAQLRLIGRVEREMVVGQIEALVNFEPGLLERPVHFSARLSHQCAAIAAVQRFEGLGRATLAGADAVKGAGEVGGQLLFGTRVPQAERSVQVAVGRREGRFAVAGQLGEVAGGQGIDLLLGQRLIVQRGEQAVQGSAIFEKVDGAGEVGHGGLLR